MLVIVAILLFCGLVVRHKWRNAAAKKDEILRLVAITSEEEAVIAKLQAVEECSLLPQPLPQREKRYYCAVCHSPTTTRCSQCKAVRYCSGRCQIIHWREGHKDDCKQTSVLNACKESDNFAETGPENHSWLDLDDETALCPDRTLEIGDSGSSTSNSCFSSSTKQSETSFDTSVSEVLESDTHIKPDKSYSVNIGSQLLQRLSDSDHVEAQSPFTLNSTVHTIKKRPGPDKVKRMLYTKFDEIKPTNVKNERNEEGTIEFRGTTPAASELKASQSSNPVRTMLSASELKTSSSSNFAEAEDQKIRLHPSTTKVMISISSHGPISHQMQNSELTSQCSKSLKMSPSSEFWKGKAEISSGKEARSMSFRSSGIYEKMNLKPENPHAFPPENEDVQMLTQPSAKGLKTSVRKLVQQFRVPKQSKAAAFDTGKDSGKNQKALFPLKLFMQIYSCYGLELHPFGLVNCGNSCYANAVLQCLTFTRPITSYLLQGLHSKTCCKREWCFICEFECMIQRGQEMRAPLSPFRIMSQIPMIGSHLARGREEDAHEFLRNAVDMMQSICLEGASVSGPVAEDSTLVGLTFGGYLRSKIKCMKCLGRSERYDRMMDLTVEIDGNIYTLEEALEQFTTSEILGGDDKYKCSRCKSYEKAKKKLTVLEAPNILTIVLKRFRSSNFEKLSKFVQFPEVLNLAPYMSGMSDKYPIYHLYAVIVHLGVMNAAYSGHYISYVKNFQGDWFRIDDCRVSPVEPETVLSVEAYIVFYARDTPRGSSLGKVSGICSDANNKRNIEPISSNSCKKKTSKAKPSSSCRSTECITQHNRTEKPSCWLPPHDFTGNHTMDPDGWRFQPKLRHPIDSSSDSSSIFSSSDAGSCSTDSTKDSST